MTLPNMRQQKNMKYRIFEPNYQLSIRLAFYFSKSNFVLEFKISFHVNMFLRLNQTIKMQTMTLT